MPQNHDPKLIKIRQRFSFILLCLALLFLNRPSPILDAASARVPVASLSQGDTAGVRVVGGAVPANQVTPLAVEVSVVTNLGAMTARIGYDPAVVRAVSCRRNPAFAVGLCNLEVDRDGDDTPDAVLFNLISLTGQEAGSAPLSLMDIVWEPVGTPMSGTLSTLTIEILTFTDSSGLPMAVTAKDGQIVFVDQVIFNNYLPYLATGQ